MLLSPASTIWVTDSEGLYQTDWPALGSEGLDTQHYGCTVLGWTGPISDPTNHTEGGVAFRHGGPDIANVLWCDGHAKAKRVGDLMQKNAAGYMWQFTMGANPN